MSKFSRGECIGHCIYVDDCEHQGCRLIKEYSLTYKDVKKILADKEKQRLLNEKTGINN